MGHDQENVTLPLSTNSSAAVGLISAICASGAKRGRAGAAVGEGRGVDVGAAGVEVGSSPGEAVADAGKRAAANDAGVEVVISPNGRSHNCQMPNPINNNTNTELPYSQRRRPPAAVTIVAACRLVANRPVCVGCHHLPESDTCSAIPSPIRAASIAATSSRAV